MTAPTPISVPAKGMLNRCAAFASIAVATLLLALKGWAVASTGSLAMLGSLADTLLDLVASLATLLGVWIAATTALAMARPRRWRRCSRSC
jgi:ferrous-iron efflux pump FieF